MTEFEQEHKGMGACSSIIIVRLPRSPHFLITTPSVIPMLLVVKWLEIHLRIRKMIRSVFEAATAVHPEMHSPGSRAIYGVDVMLDSSFQPKLLEVCTWNSECQLPVIYIFIYLIQKNDMLFVMKVTYCPDCTRACKYDTESIVGGGVIKGQDFFNDVFGCLFLNETTHVNPL